MNLLRKILSISAISVICANEMFAQSDSFLRALPDTSYNNTIKDTLVLKYSRGIVPFETIVREGNKHYAVTSDGQKEEITSFIDGKTRVLVKDGNGHELVIDKDGNVMGVEEYKKCGGSKALLRESIREKDSQVAKSGNVKFYGTSDYLFDSYDTYANHSSASSYAQRFPSIGEGDYKPAYACAESNTKIDIKAAPYANITFKNERGVPLICKDGILEVTARGDRDTTSIYAYDAENHIVGKVNVLSYDKVTRKICLVPIGDTKAPDASAVKQGLDDIFAKLMVDFEVTIGEPITIQYAKDNVFTHGGSGVIGVYNTDQKAAIAKLKEMGVDEETAYLFLVEKSNALKDNDDKDYVSGYMPRGYQFGFIYHQVGDVRTIAHELCHGAFHLKHTFDETDYLAAEGTTDNLMDYNHGEVLNHWQWKDVHQPKSVRFKWLQEEEGAEALGNNTHAKCINEKAAEALLKYRYFYLPDKRVIDIQSVSGYLPSGFYTEKDGNETDNARGALFAVRSGNYDKVVYYGNNTKQVTSFGHHIGEQVSKVPIDKFKVYDAIPSDVTPVKVYVRENEILVYSKGELLETIPNTGGCDCITNEIATPSFFVASSNVTKAYIEYATSHSMPVGESIFTDGELADILCKRIKEGKTSELGELIEDKLLAYKDLNGKNFIVVDVQTDVVCESQQAWNKLAKTVFQKAGLSDNDILITVPYIVCEGIGRDLGKVYFMPGLAYGAGVKIDIENISKQHVNTASTSQFASGTALQPIAKFVMDVFTQTYKRVEIYRGIYTATNAIYCERYTNNNEEVAGYDFNRRIVLYKQKGIDEILSIMKEADRAKQLIAYQLATYGEDGPCYSCPSYEELTQEKAFVEDYYKYAIVEKVKQIGDNKNDLESYVPQTYDVKLKEQFMSSPNSEYKELANNAEAYIYSDAFKELIETLEYKHPNGFESFSFAPEHAFTNVWDYKLRPIDESIYNTIDGVGVVLGAFGLDIFSDVAGMAYSSFRGDGMNVAAYSASVLFIGPEGFLVKKRHI